MNTATANFNWRLIEELATNGFPRTAMAELGQTAEHAVTTLARQAARTAKDSVDRSLGFEAQCRAVAASNQVWRIADALELTERVLMRVRLRGDALLKTPATSAPAGSPVAAPPVAAPGEPGQAVA